MWSESIAIFDPYNAIRGETDERGADRVSEFPTFDEMWEKLKNRDGHSRKFYTEAEMLTDWFMVRPHWWQFRKYWAWRKAKPKLGGADRE